MITTYEQRVNVKLQQTQINNILTQVDKIWDTIKTTLNSIKKDTIYRTHEEYCKLSSEKVMDERHYYETNPRT